MLLTMHHDCGRLRVVILDFGLVVWQPEVSAMLVKPLVDHWYNYEKE